MSRRVILSAVLVAVSLVTGSGGASAVCSSDGQLWPVTPVVPASSRLDVRHLDGYKVNVLLPPGYLNAGNNRRYPVLYILHGGGWGAEQGPDTYLAFTDLITLTATGPGVIVVMPYGGMGGLYSDWADGTQQWETYHLRHVVPYVDANFRTIADGAHRALAGESMGGYGVARYPAKYPDMFAAAGSFLGLTDLRIGGALSAVLKVAGVAYAACDGGNGDGLYGSREIDWANNNPTDLAPNLGGVELYISASRGLPCTAADVAREGQGYPILGAADREINERFHAALLAAGVPHTSDLRDCGWHDWPEVNESLHRFWPLMLHAFGSAPPSSFDYRSADPSFVARGWRFLADPARASEFLDATNVSCRGLGLAGSGLTTVTTATCFEPGDAVEVSAADATRTVTADSLGRITFTVDLGPAHQFEQYTPAASLLEAASRGGYTRSRMVTFGTE